MNKKIKQVELKTVLIGSAIVLLIVVGMVTITSALSDVILFSLYKRPFHFSLFQKTVDGFVIYSVNSTTHSEILDRNY